MFKAHRAVTPKVGVQGTGQWHNYVPNLDVHIWVTSLSFDPWHLIVPLKYFAKVVYANPFNWSKSSFDPLLYWNNSTKFRFGHPIVHNSILMPVFLWPLPPFPCFADAFLDDLQDLQMNHKEVGKGKDMSEKWQLPVSLFILLLIFCYKVCLNMTVFVQKLFFI